ncbi:hypothetical protein [Spiroplasma sp. ald]|uniref:hypothetical protein n=1 Tax=Spiroplasma sp. ald TaxID=2490849 RepID=UPI0037DDCF4A
MPFNNNEFNKKIFTVPFSFIKENNFNLWPSYYADFINCNETIIENEEKVFFTIEELINNNILESTDKKLLLSGNSIESINYSDQGEIPFLRTIDIKNLEIVRNPQKFGF